MWNTRGEHFLDNLLGRDYWRDHILGGWIILKWF
jgi:hypothetical protein